jgi:hypothetical protein
MLTPDYPQLNRRHFLKHLAGFSLMAIPGLHFISSLASAAPILKKNGKSIIILWMGGGPSHMDIWDLKPGEATGGDFKPINTAVSGIQICELMPVTAKQFNHLTVIRSLVTNEGSHERGRVLMHTARQPSQIVSYPSIGAVASHELTSKDLDLPGFISVGGPADGPGFLGMNYAPFTVQNPGQPPANIRPPDSLGKEKDQEERINRRRRMFYTVEDEFILEKRGEAAQSHHDIYKKAFSLVASPRGKVFDLSGEKKSLQDEYGNNGFGKGCLLARRLVEAGVTAVEVDLGGWDNHNNIFPTLKTKLPMLDKGMGTLVKDLVNKGLWKDTVLVWMGEFGRTPKINQNAGRDHWARCWSVVIGGGAIKGGIAYGSTDKDGTSIQDKPVTVNDLFATLYKGLGMDPNPKVSTIRDNLGRQFEIAGVDKEGKTGRPIKELVG